MPAENGTIENGNGENGDNGNEGGDQNTNSNDQNGQDPDGQQNASGGDNGDSGSLDFSDPKATEAEIKRLRAENAKHRTRNKELDSKFTETNERLGKFESGLKKLFGEEENDLTPEQQIQTLQEQNETLAVQTAIKDAAYEYGIKPDNYEYFEFLVNKRLGTLKDGEELTEDDIDEIAKKANGSTANSNTSVGAGTGDDGGQPPANDDGELTLEEFMEMGINQKSMLFSKQPELYKRLASQERLAKQKR